MLVRLLVVKNDRLWYTNLIQIKMIHLMHHLKSLADDGNYTEKRSGLYEIKCRANKRAT